MELCLTGKTAQGIHDCANLSGNKPEMVTSFFFFFENTWLNTKVNIQSWSLEDEGNETLTDRASTVLLD